MLQPGTGSRAHSLPAGVVPSVTLVIGNELMMVPWLSMICDVSPLNRSGVLWKHSSLTPSLFLQRR